MKKNVRIYAFFLAFGVVFGLGIVLGQYEGEKQYNNDTIPIQYQGENGLDFGIFWQEWDFIEKNYVEQPVDKIKLFQGAMAGSVAALGDPYSVYFDPETLEKFSQELSGAFEGIGAEIGIKNEVLTVIAPLADSPAERAGLRAGDTILAIDGLDTSMMSLDYAVSIIRGEKGTDVTLLIFSKDQDEAPRDIVITRDTITIHSVESRMFDNGIAYIKLMNFNDKSGDEFKAAVKKILNQNPQGIILDLRNNPGGFLNDAIFISSFWVKNGQLVVSEKSAAGQINEYRSSGSKALLSQLPTVVLINEGSASASEIVAAALKEYHLAILLGKTSFGKGSVQEIREFADGSAIKLTVAKWLTPDGNEIENIGVTPDIEVELTREDYNNDQDPQLDKAIEILTKNEILTKK